MITVGLLSVCLIAALGIPFFFLARLWTIEVAFVRVAWVPVTALLLEGLFFRKIAAAISYFAVALPVLTCIVSLFLTLMGVTLVASARQREEDDARLLRATVVASIPGAVLLGYILYAFTTGSLSSSF